MRFFLSLFLVIISTIAFAHQPKLIKYSPSKQNPHEIINPEISKAYYSQLTGKPHYYIIESEKEFLLRLYKLDADCRDNPNPNQKSLF